MRSIFTLIVELLFLNAMELFGIKERSALMISILIGAFSLAFCMDVENDRTSNYLKHELLLGYFCRLFMLYFDMYGHSIYVLPNSGADSSMFFAGALRVYNGAETGRTFFPVVMGYIFRWIGVSRLYGQFLVMLCSIVSFYLLARMMPYFHIPVSIQKSTMMIVAVLPNVLILSVVFLRESIVTMFITIALYCFVRWASSGKEVWFGISFASIGMAAFFHSGAAGMALGLIIVRLLYDRKKNQIHLRFANIVLATALSIFITFIYLNYGEVLFTKMARVDSLSDIANTNEAGGSSYAAYVGNSDSISNMIIYTIPRIIYFLFSPFPWQWRGFSDIIAFFGSSLFYILSVYSAIRCIINRRSDNHVLAAVILLIAIGVVFVFAWGCANTGTAARHREKMVMIFALLWAVSQDSFTRDDRHLRQQII